MYLNNPAPRFCKNQDMTVEHRQTVCSHSLLRLSASSLVILSVIDKRKKERNEENNLRLQKLQAYCLTEVPIILKLPPSRPVRATHTIRWHSDY